MSDKVLKSALFTNALLNGLATLTTGTIDLRSIKDLQSIRVKASSVLAQGNIDFSISWATSDYMAPIDSIGPVEGSPAEDFDAFNTVLLDHWNATSFPTDWQVLPLPAPLAPFVKIRFAGLGSNPSDTLITAKLIYRESF